jgi:hypothetical protein
MSIQEYQKLERDAKAADALRQGFYALKRKNVFWAISWGTKCIWYNPSYLFTKIKHNLIRK